MIRNGTISLLSALLLGVLSQARGEAGGTPEFREIYDAIKAHSSISPAELNQAAVQGLLSELAPRVILVTNGSASRASATTPLVSKSSLMEGDIAYVRIERVGEGLPKAVREAWETLSHSNKLQGIVLDLRYADGSDYAAAAGTADLFLKKEKPDPILVPAAVLVNHFTSEAAEALAAALRASGAGLILGRRTAGQAMVMQDFPLSNGDQLRIATAPVQLGDGAALSMHGVRPDITVEVTRDEERAYYADAFRLPGKTDLSASAGLSLTNAVGNTNRVARRPRFNEAELVRERREGLSEGDMTGAKDYEADKPVVYDPALARALDLLKGLAVVRQTRS